MKRILTHDDLVTKDIETLGFILEELCERLGYSDEQMDELFDDTIKRDDNFELDREDAISWILILQNKI